MKRALPVTVDAAEPSPITEQLSEQIYWLIALGELKPADQLPTVQELADGLRINRNTVASAYARLRDEGYLVARQGVGTFVAHGDAARRAVQRAELGRIVDAALGQATAMGFAPAEFAEAAAARARIHAALRARRTALFVECNWPEIEHHSRTLAEEIGVSIDGVHLDDVRQDPIGFRRRARSVDLVVTTFFHVEEVRAAVGRSAEVVSVGAGLEIQFLRSLAQLARGTRVAICCLDRDRASRIRTLVVNAGVQHLDMLAVGVDEEQRLRRALDETDVVFVSLAARPQAERIVGAARLRTYQLGLDRAGIEMLKVRLAEAGRSGAAPRATKQQGGRSRS